MKKVSKCFPWELEEETNQSGDVEKGWTWAYQCVYMYIYILIHREGESCLLLVFGCVCTLFNKVDMFKRLRHCICKSVPLCEHLHMCVLTPT